MSAALDSKTEQALAAYLAAVAGLETATIYTGEDSTEKAAPCIKCVVEPGGEEDPPGYGNFWKDATIIVNSAAAVDADGVDPKSAHDALVLLVENAVNIDNLPAQLSAAMDDFTCQAALSQGSGSAQSGDVWQSEIKTRLYVCNSDLSP